MRTTHKQLAQRLGITPQAVSLLAKKKVFTPGADLDQWTREAWAYISEVAAERNGPLAIARTRLAARQSERIEMQLQQLRAELAPVETVAEKLILPFATTIAKKLRTLPSRCQESGEDFAPSQTEIIERLVLDQIKELDEIQKQKRLELRKQNHG